MIVKTFALIAVAATALAPTSAPMSFDMKDPKGVSGLSFAIDSQLEPIRGTSGAVSGTIMFDAANPANSSGKIIVQTAEVKTSSERMTERMIGDACLDAEKYPTIEFEITKVSNVTKSANGVYSADVAGKFSMHGVSKNINIKATASHLPDMIQKRGGMPGKKGDVLIIRSKFSINRLDYAVMPDFPTEVIGDKVEVDLASAGVMVRE